MKWPWVGRLAYDTLAAECERLRTDNQRLLDHAFRIDRVDHGLHELPHEQRPKIEPMPPALKQYIASFALPQFRRMMQREVYRRHLQGESWSSILEALTDRQEGDHAATVDERESAGSRPEEGLYPGDAGTEPSAGGAG